MFGQVCNGGGVALLGRFSGGGKMGLASPIDRFYPMKTLEINRSPPVGSMPQNISKLISPKNFIGSEGMPGVDGLGQSFIDAGENDDNFDIGCCG